MKIYEKLDTTEKVNDNSEIVCIGAFDGVHLAPVSYTHLTLPTILLV